MKNSGVISSLTSLRFLAALAIFIHHCNGFLVFGPTEEMPLSTGVGFFFVLSGYILSHVYLSASGRAFDSLKFIAYRAARVWPAHLAALVLLLSIMPETQWVKQSVDFTSAAVANALMLHSLIPIPDYYFSFNWVSWSISTEFFFYLLFPVVVLIVGRGAKQSFIWFIVVSLIGFVIAGLCDFLSLDYYPSDSSVISSHGITYINPLCRFQEFCIGVAANIIGRKFDFGYRGGKSVSTLFEILVICLFGIFFIDLYVFFRNTGSRVGPAMSEYLSHYSSGFVFAIVIVFFAKSRGVVTDILSVRPLVILGEISFSFYLVHQILLRYYLIHQDQFLFISTEAKPYFLLVISLLLSYELWQWVERPAQSMLRRGFDRVHDAAVARRQAKSLSEARAAE